MGECILIARAWFSSLGNATGESAIFFIIIIFLKILGLDLGLCLGGQQPIDLLSLDLLVHLIKKTNLNFHSHS